MPLVVMDKKYAVCIIVKDLSQKETALQSPCLLQLLF